MGPHLASADVACSKKASSTRSACANAPQPPRTAPPKPMTPNRRARRGTSPAQRRRRTRKEDRSEASRGGRRAAPRGRRLTPTVNAAANGRRVEARRAKRRIRVRRGRIEAIRRASAVSAVSAVSANRSRRIRLRFRLRRESRRRRRSFRDGPSEKSEEYPVEPSEPIFVVPGESRRISPVTFDADVAAVVVERAGGGSLRRRGVSLHNPKPRARNARRTRGVPALLSPRHSPRRWWRVWPLGSGRG